MGPRTDGEGLDWSRLQVSLFDVADPRHPTREAVLDVAPQGGNAWSDAQHEHKAFTYWDAIGVLAIPMTTYAMDGDSRQHAGLRLLDVDTDAGRIALRGEVDQDTLMDEQHAWNSIERSYFLGVPELGVVSVYAIGALGATAHDLKTLKLQAAVPFPQDPQGGAILID
jgi:hypothetical protein